MLYMMRSERQEQGACVQLYFFARSLTVSQENAQLKQSNIIKISFETGISHLFIAMGFSFKAFNPDNEYHFKNRMKVCQRNWAEVFGEGNMHAVSPISTFQKVSMAMP